MNFFSVSKKISTAFSFLVIIIAVSLSQECYGGNDAPGGNKFEGVWTGEATGGKNSSAVTLTLQSIKSTLAFGSPRSCALDLESPINTDTNSRKYAIISSNGVPCDKFFPGKLFLKMAGKDDNLLYEVTDSTNKILEKGQLHRAGKKP